MTLNSAMTIEKRHMKEVANTSWRLWLLAWPITNCGHQPIPCHAQAVQRYFARERQGGWGCPFMWAWNPS